MTIEQKAKAYDEAIKLAKDSYNYPSYPGFIRADVVFPELKESEDEKIRKAIIEFFELQDDNTTYSLVPKKDIITWLEKQGEQKPAELSQSVVTETSDQVWSEEDESNLDLAIYHIRREPYRESDVEPIVDWLRTLKDRVQPQPKQEWSEEDSYMLESIVSDFAAGHKSSIGQDKWLKSLKPQNHWKPTEPQLVSLTIASDRNDRVGFELTQLLKELKKL